MKALIAILLCLALPVMGGVMVVNSYRFSSGGTALLTSLAAYYSLEESSGTRADETAGNADLTDNNTVTSATGKVGTAASFDSANSEYLNNADPAAMTFGTQVSVSFWAYPTSLADNQTLVGKWEYSGGKTGSFVCLTAGGGTTLRVFVFADASDLGNNYSDFASVLANNTWVHIVVIYDGTEGTDTNRVKVYANGSLVARSGGGGSIPASMDDGDAEFMLGRISGLGWYWLGRIDEVGVWNRKLDGTDIGDLYNSGSGLPYSSF